MARPSICPPEPTPAQGGFVVDTTALGGVNLGDSIRGALHGYWGFDEYTGPSFQLVNARAQTLALAAKDQGALIVGREDTVHLQADSVSCIDGIMLKDPAGKQLKAEWKPVTPNEVEVKLPLQEAQPGPVTLLVTQYGAEPAAAGVAARLRRCRTPRWLHDSRRRCPGGSAGQPSG